MNKKFKKALYMLGFALPIVAIPIITVACGTQTSQVEPTPTPAPEQQPNKEPEIKKMEEVKPNLSVLKNKEITEDILSQDIKNLLLKWEQNPGKKFNVGLIKSNSLFSKIIESKIDAPNDSTPKLKEDLKYSEISDIIKKLKFVDLFDINNLGIKNLNNEKLEDIKLEDVFSNDSKKLFDSINNSPDQVFAKKDSDYDNKDKDGIKQKIEKLISENKSSAFQKIKDDLDNKEKKIDSKKFKEILGKLKFSELIDIDKLQEKLIFIK